MNVKFDFVSELKENLADYIDTFEHPVIVTDSELKICAKNRVSRFYITGMEVGKTARGFVSDDNFIRIRDLKTHETTSCDIEYGTVSYGARVYAFEELRFIIVNPVASSLCKRIRDIYEEMSGYDLSISDDVLLGEALSKKLRTRSAAAFVTERLRENLEARKIPFFDMEKTVKGFVEELNSIGIRARVSTFGEKEENNVSAGPEGDFLLLLAVAVFLVDENNGRILFETGNDGGKSYCRMIIDGDAPIEDYESVLSGNLENRFEGSLSEEKFWSRIAYLISNANLWDVSLESKGGKFIFTVSSELTSHYTGCIFRDEDKMILNQVIKTFFK